MTDPAPSRPRRRARELALQLLYQIDLIGPERLERLDEFFDGAREPLPTDARAYAAELVRGVVARRESLDRAIADVARNWAVERMAVVDRNVLRLAAYELLYRDEIPRQVAIDEAVEIGQAFSTEGSGAFVNGVLDALERQGAPAETAETAGTAGIAETE